VPHDGNASRRCNRSGARRFPKDSSTEEGAMADNRTRRGPADRTRINLSEAYEVRYWCRELQVPPAELRAAVGKVGPMVDDVRAELARGRPRAT
jgi:hypothetical protein